MTSQVDPIGTGSAIADKTGQPTPFFVRQWNNLLALVFDVRSALATALTANAGVIALNARNINTSGGLQGGGNLSADRTLSLTDTAVTPATYGDAAHVGQFTVDQKGRLTAASNVALTAAITIKDEGSTLTSAPTSIDFTGLGVTATAVGAAVTVNVPAAGGGGTSANTATLAVTLSTTATISFAALGNVFTPSVNMSATGLGIAMTTVSSATIKFGIAPYSRSTNKVTGAPTYTSTVTIGTGAAKQPVYANFASPFAMTAGSDYIIFMVRTDGATTVSQTVFFASPDVQAPGIFLSTTVSVTAWQLASTGPGTGDTWSTSGGGVWSMTMVYSL